MAASAAVSVLARSWRGHRTDCGGGGRGGGGGSQSQSQSQGLSSTSDNNNGAVPATNTRTNTKHRQKASTLPPETTPDGAFDAGHRSRSASTSIGSRIKDFFRSTVRRQLRSASSSSTTASASGFLSVSDGRDGHDSRGTKLRCKSHSPATVPAKPRTKKTTATKGNANGTVGIGKKAVTSVGTQNGYSCSCSIEVLQESPRAGRTLRRYNGIASSHDSVELDSLFYSSGVSDGHSNSHRAPDQDSAGGYTEESSQGGGTTDSLCDPWEHSSTCTSTSSPRLRTSSCASQCSAPEGAQPRPRRRAFSSGSSQNHTHTQWTRNGVHILLEETAEHTLTPLRPRSNSSRIPTSTFSRTGQQAGDSPYSVPRFSSQSTLTPSGTPTSTQNNTRGIHIRNFRSRLPKLRSPTVQTKALTLPTATATSTSPSPARDTGKAVWPQKHKTKAKKQV